MAESVGRAHDRTKLLAVFSPRQRAGKTSTAASFAWTLAEKGHRVLLYDCDPQRSLSLWLLGKKLSEFKKTTGCESSQLYHKYITRAQPRVEEQRLPRTLFDQLEVVCSPSASVVPAFADPVGRNLWLVPGDTRIGKYDAECAIAYACKGGLQIPYLYQCINATALLKKADYVILDLASNSGSLNCALVMQSHYIVVPAAPIFTSCEMLAELPDLLQEWEKKVLRYKQWLTASEKQPLCFPAHSPVVLGFVISGYDLKDGCDYAEIKRGLARDTVCDLQKDIVTELLCQVELFVREMSNNAKQFLLPRDILVDLKRSYTLALLPRFKEVQMLAERCHKPAAFLDQTDFSCIEKSTDGFIITTEAFEKAVKRLLLLTHTAGESMVNILNAVAERTRSVSVKKTVSISGTKRPHPSNDVDHDIRRRKTDTPPAASVEETMLHVTTTDKKVFLSWSKTGELAVSYGRKIKIFSRELEKLHVLNHHTSFILGLSFSVDGHGLVSCSEDNTVCLWEKETKETKVIFVGGEGKAKAVTSAEWSQNGKHILVACGEQINLLFDVRQSSQPAEKQLLLQHTGKVTCAAWSRKDEFIASVCEANLLCVWKSDGTQGPTNTRQYPITCLSWSTQDHSLLSGDSKGQVFMWYVYRNSNPQSQHHFFLANSHVFVNHSAQINCLAWSPTLHEFASASADGVLCFMRTGFLSRARERQTLDAEVVSVAYSAEGLQLAVSTGKNELLFFDTNATQPDTSITQAVDTTESKELSVTADTGDGSSKDIFSATDSEDNTCDSEDEVEEAADLTEEEPLVTHFSSKKQEDIVLDDSHYDDLLKATAGDAVKDEDREAESDDEDFVPYGPWLDAFHECSLLKSCNERKTIIACFSEVHGKHEPDEEFDTDEDEINEKLHTINPKKSGILDVTEGMTDLQVLRVLKSLPGKIPDKTHSALDKCFRDKLDSGADKLQKEIYIHTLKRRIARLCDHFFLLDDFEQVYNVLEKLFYFITDICMYEDVQDIDFDILLQNNALWYYCFHEYNKEFPLV